MNSFSENSEDAKKQIASEKLRKICIIYLYLKVVNEPALLYASSELRITSAREKS